jgi:hypothetical protein
MKRFQSIAVLILLLISSMPLHAQGDWFVETMFSSGKIYVVVAVAAVVLAGIFAYLIWMDLRLRKLEDENNDGE